MLRPNIVLLAIDSLRADHLGCYGYDRDTSPNIDALAAESMLFERAFAPGIPTMPSFTTLLSGQHPLRHGITAHASDQRLCEDVRLLPQLAKDAGYVTIGIDNLTAQGNGRGSWFARGFDYLSGFLYKPFSDQGAQLCDRALGFIEEFQAKPFLLYLHLWEPHTPYGPLPPFDTRFYRDGGEMGREKLRQVKALSPAYYEAFLTDMRLRVPDDYDYVVAQYDGEIASVDTQIGRVLDGLKARGLWENTVTVLLSDHGEAFGEGEVYFDHHGLYDAVSRVVLLCRTPDAKTGRSRVFTSTEDVLPTLCEECGLILPQSATGRSLSRALHGDETPLRHELVCLESTRQASIALRTDKWKLIQPILQDKNGQPLPDIYGQPRDPRPLLFDLESDPGETRDVADEQPQVRDAMMQRLAALRAEAVAARGGRDPLLDGLSLPYDDFMRRLAGRGLRG